MSLSICILTRNAEAHLPMCLRSVARLGVQIIVADTGSTDRTVEIALEHGATTPAIEWYDDFGAAQNEAIGHAHGDWILWLNPDEELTPQGQHAIPSLLAHPQALAYAVRIGEVTKERQPASGSDVFAPRLFRRLPEVRFRGRAHPQFEPPLESVARERNLRIFYCNLLIERHGYLSVLTADKLRWVNRLLELELQDRPGQLHYLIEFGRNLLRLNDPKGHEVLAEAAEQVIQAQNAPNPPTTTVASLLEYLLTVSPSQSRSRVDAGLAATLALRWFSASPPLLWVLAQKAFEAQDFRRAAGLLERMIELGRSGAFDQSAGFDRTILGAPAILNLGICYLRLQELDRAAYCFGQLLTHPTHGVKAQQGYAAVQAKRQQS